MPTSVRKSSVGAARRGPIKAHLPYRGDQSEVGKKTGLPIPEVERHSDGFEPFEEVLRRVDGLTAPKPKRKKSIVPVVNPEYDEEDGEMSMQLDSPVNNLASMRPPSSPSTLKRVGSTSRPVARTSDVDFDRIPSPKFRSQSRASYGPGPSSLSKSISRRDVEPESDSPDEGGGYDDGGQDNVDMDVDDGNGGFDDYGPQESSPTPSQRTPKETSFRQMNQDDDEEEGEEDEPPEETPTKNKRDKGKGRAVVEEEQEDDEVEDDIANGLEDVGQEHYSDDEEEEEEPEVRPKAKKVKLQEQTKRKPRTETRSRGKKENKAYREGVRKSAREHYKPLEWWRGEKVVYGRSEDSGSKILVPPICEIRRIPKEAPLPLGKRKRGPRSRSAKAVSATPAPAAALNPEEGWDEDTPESCPVLVYGADNLEPVTRRIAWTARMVKPRPAANADWSFDKIFGDGEFIAAGQLVIPPNGRKPSKASKDNTYVFYVVEGAVNLKIHDTSLVLATGGMFMVPRGNTYFIENICNRDAKLFFTQARKVAASPEELENEARHAGAKRALTRSSSAGPMGTPGQTNGRARSKSVARAASTKT